MLFIPYLFVFSSNASLSQNSFSSPLFHTPFSYIIFCHCTFPIPESQCFLLFFIWWLFSYLHTSYSATSLLYPASLKSSSSLPVFHSTSPLWRSLVLLSATSQGWDFLPAAEHFCGVCLMERMQHPYCRWKVQDRVPQHTDRVERLRSLCSSKGCQSFQGHEPRNQSLKALWLWGSCRVYNQRYFTPEWCLEWQNRRPWVNTKSVNSVCSW